MPSKSKAQAKFMRGIAHGMKPRGGGGPSQAQAKEFVRADQARGVGQLPARKVAGAIMNNKPKESIY